MADGLTVSGGCGCSGASAAPQLAGVQLGGTAKRRPSLAGPAPQLGTDWWDSAKGEIMTQALAASGYATDPASLRAYYRDHKQVIDDYLSYVDVGEVAQALIESESGRQAQKVGAVFLAGFAGGVAATLLYQRFSNQKSS